MTLRLKPERAFGLNKHCEKLATVIILFNSLARWICETGARVSEVISLRRGVEWVLLTERQDNSYSIGMLIVITVSFGGVITLKLLSRQTIV